MDRTLITILQFSPMQPVEGTGLPLHIDTYALARGGKIAFSNYWIVENEYVAAVLTSMERLKIPRLAVSLLDKGLNNKAPLKLVLSGGNVYPLEALDPIIRYCLRDWIFCRLYYERDFYITFGHDMTMYIGVMGRDFVNPIPQSTALSCVDVSERVIDTSFHFFGAVPPTVI